MTVTRFTWGIVKSTENREPRQGVDPAEYYFRVVATLETGAPEYYWLNERLFVASAVRQVDAVMYDLYAVS